MKRNLGGEEALDVWEWSDKKGGAGIYGQNVTGSAGRGTDVVFIVGTVKRSKNMIDSSHFLIVSLHVTSFHADFVRVRSGSGDGFDSTIRFLLLGKNQFGSKF